MHFLPASMLLSAVNYDFFCWKEGMTWNGIRFCYLSLLAFVFAGVLRELSKKKNPKKYLGILYI
jgi:hypothetical protein